MELRGLLFLRDSACSVCSRPYFELQVSLPVERNSKATRFDGAGIEGVEKCRSWMEVRDLCSADKRRKSPRGSGIAKSMTYPSPHANRTHDSRRLN